MELQPASAGDTSSARPQPERFSRYTVSSMLKAISTYVFIKERLHAGLLDALQRGGAEAIEIFGARDHFDYTNRAHVKEVAGWFQSTGVQFHSFHAPMFFDYEWGRSGGAPVHASVKPQRA